MSGSKRWFLTLKKHSWYAYKFDQGKLNSESDFLNINIFNIITNTVEHPVLTVQFDFQEAAVICK